MIYISIKDFVLVYVKSLQTNLSERSIIVSNIREKFIKVLSDDYKIQVIEVGFQNFPFSFEILE